MLLAVLLIDNVMATYNGSWFEQTALHRLPQISTAFSVTGTIPEDPSDDIAGKMLICVYV